MDKLLRWIVETELLNFEKYTHHNENNDAADCSKENKMSSSALELGPKIHMAYLVAANLEKNKQNSKVLCYNEINPIKLHTYYVVRTRYISFFIHFYTFHFHEK